MLINERVLMVQPSLVMALGLQEALFLQQVHFWTSDGRGTEREGRVWVYNTYDGWHEQFPWWSPSNIRRIVANLEAGGYLISRTDMNAHRSDRTKWYAIDYARVDELDADPQDDDDHVQDPADGLPESSHMDPQDPDASSMRQRTPKENQPTQRDKRPPLTPAQLHALDPVADRALILRGKVRPFPPAGAGRDAFAAWDDLAREWDRRR